MKIKDITATNKRIQKEIKIIAEARDRLRAILEEAELVCYGCDSALMSLNEGVEELSQYL